MVDRSPNFPSLSLGDAVDAIKKVYAAEGRSKAPRLSIVKPLGYTSINGRSLSVLGALKAYGLIEGRSDELRISQEGFTLANAPADSPEYREALLTSFRSPTAFQRFSAEDGAASPDTLKWKLQKGGFQPDSAERLVRIYRESRDFLNAAFGDYRLVDEAEASAGLADTVPANHAVSDDMAQMALAPDRLAAAKRFIQNAGGSQPNQDQAGLAMGVHERVLQSGMLSKTAHFRVIVSGQVGVSEIERLVKKLEMDKEILADADPEWDGPDDEDRDTRD